MGFLINPYNFAASGGVGGWVELGRTTLGSAASSITVSSLANKRYYMILESVLGAANFAPLGTFNGDTGTNYANRYSSDGSADSTSGGSAGLIMYSSGLAGHEFSNTYVSNKSDKEKLMICHSMSQNTAGAGTAPKRRENFNKWANTSNSISSFTATNTEAGNFTAGSEVVVLGWDPADTHTNNFWTELASADLSGGVSNTLSASFTAKKYLWIQAFIDGTATADVAFRVGNTSLDSGNNYAYRYSSDGGSDTTSVSQAHGSNLTTTTPIFHNIFIINNSANEKLMIRHVARQNTAGAGTAPRRFEEVIKWANTSNQINIAGFVNIGTGNMKTNSILKVWGSN